MALHSRPVRRGPAAAGGGHASVAAYPCTTGIRSASHKSPPFEQGSIAFPTRARQTLAVRPHTRGWASCALQNRLHGVCTQGHRCLGLHLGAPSTIRCRRRHGSHCVDSWCAGVRTGGGSIGTAPRAGASRADGPDQLWRLARGFSGFFQLTSHPQRTCIHRSILVGYDSLNKRQHSGIGCHAQHNA